MITNYILQMAPNVMQRVTTLHLLELIIIVILCTVLIYLTYMNYKTGKLKNKSNKLNDTIKIYSMCKKILEVAKADFITYIVYDYSKRFIVTHFTFLIDKNGKIKYNQANVGLPVTTNSFFLSVLNSDDKDLYQVYKSELSNNEVLRRGIYDNMTKVYYQNIFKNEEINPIGYIVIAYENDYIMPETDKKTIIKYIKEIKNLL